MNYFLGLDPGKSGAFCILDEDKNIVGKGVIPTIGKKKSEYDKQAIRNIFTMYNYKVVTIEVPGAIFGIGKSAAMSLSHCVGLLEGMAYSTMSKNCRLIMVKPKEWQKEMHKNTNKKYKTKVTTDKDGNKVTKEVPDAKATTECAIMDFYPNEDFRATTRSKIRHDGIMDAVLICYYGSL